MLQQYRFELVHLLKCVMVDNGSLNLVSLSGLELAVEAAGLPAVFGVQRAGSE